MALTVDLDDVAEMHEDLAEAVQLNTRRYAALFADAIQEMLPNYRTRRVIFFFFLIYMFFLLLGYSINQFPKIIAKLSILI